MTGRLYWGILGTGNIARKFANDVRGLAEHKIAAVGSRNKQSADAFGADFEIQEVK